MTPQDWSKFGAPILRLEREQFPVGLREEPADLQSLIESPTSIVVGVRTKGLPFAGYLASDLLENFGDVPGTISDPHWGHGDTHYIAAIVVDPSIRHCGVATALMQACVHSARALGFRRVTAHMQSGATSKIGSQFRVLGRFPNWYGTGKPFEYVELTPQVM